MRLALEYLGRDVTERAKRIRASLRWPNKLTQSKIYNLALGIVSVICHEDVLGLEVPVRHSK